MKRFVLFLIFLVQLSSASELKRLAKAPVPQQTNQYSFGVDQMKVNASSTNMVTDDRLKSKKGVELKSDGEIGGNDKRDADVLINLEGVKEGRYVFTTQAFVNKSGHQKMSQAKTKYESMFVTIEVEGQQKTKRVIFAPWELNRQPSRQVSGKFEISPASKVVKLWLPEGVILESISLHSYVPPIVPDVVQKYKPTVVPPQSHPRLWVNSHSLPFVKGRLEEGENKQVWEKVKNEATKEYSSTSPSTGEISFDAKLEKIVETKAFYFLMTGDKKVGREAVDITKNYLSRVEFGNLLDITREIGRAIYTSSLVFDWCYSLLDGKEKGLFVHHLMRLADDMEIGWPPFKQSIINGHGNEAQVNRDLLSMSIAIYNENPQPYQYISYTVLEQLVPMRKFEYQSPRHNQGVNYGSYRFAWELHAAWLYYRMSGKPVFDDNIKNVAKFWHYMRLPNGEMLRDGDGFGSAGPGKTYYWKAPMFAFLAHTYASDPILKGDFQKQGGLANEPVLFLLLNNPDVMAVESKERLPLTIDFGPVLGSMVARTGWDMSATSNDVVAEIKGGGYHFGNHQHSDAGAIQLYYKGLQFGDLGVYRFYGTPYDVNFNKRSVAHSMMLAVDPKEVFTRVEANDGGTKYNQRFPKTPKEVMEDPWFNNGKVISAGFGPDKLKPLYSYFSVDLTAAYGNNKLEKYVRSFCFLNLNRQDIPAFIVLRDKIKTADPGFKKYWQLNALNLPVQKGDYFVLNNKQGDQEGQTFVNMLLPRNEDKSVEITSGNDTHRVFGHQYDPPQSNLQETKGHRILISPKESRQEDDFLTVFQVAAGGVKPVSVQYFTSEVSDIVVFQNNVVSMSKVDGLIDREFTIDIPKGKNMQVVLTGLQEGSWKVSLQGNSKATVESQVEKEKNTLHFVAKQGKYTVRPAQ